MKYYTKEQVEKLLEAQRSICYLAILNQTKDETLATIAKHASEPILDWQHIGQKEIEEPINEVIEIAGELSKMMDDLISDLYQVKGGAQARHSYMFYRDFVWKMIDTLKNIKY